MYPMNGRKPKTCVGCPVWLPLEQTGIPDSQKIEGCVQHVLGKERLWLSGEEFLARVREQKARHDLEARKPIDSRPTEVIEYFLKPNVMFRPRDSINSGKEVA